MTQVPGIEKYEGDLLLIRIAREIAIDHYEVPQILERYGVSTTQWSDMQANPRFQRLLSEEIQSWQSASNTPERTKLKAQAMMEEWLPEANKLLHMKEHPLNHKVELGKLVSAIAGMGQRASDGTGIGDKIMININLGADKKVLVAKDITPQSNPGQIDYSGAEDL